MINGALVNSTIFPLPRPRPRLRFGAGASEALTPLGLIDARSSWRWRLVERDEQDDLVRCLDLLSPLVGLLAGGGDFGIANSKPTIGSECTNGEMVTHEPVLVPVTVGVVASCAFR